jgi:hypothetical protein
MIPWLFVPVSLPVPSSQCHGCHHCPVLLFPPLSVVGVGVFSDCQSTCCPPCKQLLAAVEAGAGFLHHAPSIVIWGCCSFCTCSSSFLFPTVLPWPSLSCHQYCCCWHPPLSWAFFVWVSSSPPSSPNISHHHSCKGCNPLQEIFLSQDIRARPDVWIKLVCIVTKRELLM